MHVNIAFALEEIVISSHRLNRFAIALIAFGFAVPTAHAQAQKQKVIIDQDARGPLTTDINAILMFAQSPDVDVLGVTIGDGDQWVKEETLHTLRALEIAGRPDIPVVPGALYPLINNKEESEWWESQFGEFSAKGAWLQRRYHDPDFVPPLPEGDPQTKPFNEHAVDFIIRMVHKYPGEVTHLCGRSADEYRAGYPAGS